MKKRINSKFSLGMTLMLLMSSCMSISLSETPQSPTLTSTLFPTSTVTPIATPTFTITSTPVFATLINTMTSKEQKDFIREFLSDSGDCQLPCWWNISPEQPWENAEKNILSLGSILVPVFPGYDPETQVYGIPINNVIPRTDIYIEEKKGMVYAWHVTSAWELENRGEFRRVWKNYSAQKIIKAYGMPDRILLHGRSTNSFYYDRSYYLWLFYDKLGFSISYQPLIPKYFSGAPFFRICSETDTLMSIKLNMQASINPLPLDRFDTMLEEIRLGTDIGKNYLIFSLQEATGLSDEEIYQAYMQEKDPCLAIPSDIWVVK